MTDEDAKPVARLKRRCLRIAMAFVAVTAILVFPLPVRDIDRAAVLIRDAQRFQHAEPVLLGWSYRAFYDADLIAEGSPEWHLFSDLSFDLSPLESAGFIRSTEDELRRISGPGWYAEGNVLLELTDHTPDDPTARGLRLNVYHGSLAAQGYRVFVYRCLLGTIARYSIEWVS